MGEPTRAVLLSWRPLSYPIGNTPAANLLHGYNSKITDSRVLCLGCGHVRHAFATIAALPPERALAMHLNDCNDGILARAVLLLRLYQVLDTKCEADMAYLWDVTNNLEWPASTAERFASDIQQLLDGQLGLCSVAEDTTVDHPGLHAAQAGGHLAVLRNVWRYWLTALTTVDPKKTKATRRRFMASLWAQRSKLSSDAPQSMEESFDSGVQLMARIRGTACCPTDTSRSSLLDALMAEFTSWFRDGSIGSTATARVGASESAHGSSKDNLPRNALRAQASSSDRRSIQNPTLLQPFTGAWTVHYDTDPFEMFMPLPTELLKSAHLRTSTAAGTKGGGSGAVPQQYGGVLVHVCLQQLAATVAAFQVRVNTVTPPSIGSFNGAKSGFGTAKNRRKASGKEQSVAVTASAAAAHKPVSVVIHRGDCLRLCLHASSTLTSNATFDIIHTSNLADHVALANLLLCAGPRLNPANPAARLFTESHTWTALTSSQQEYLQMALGTPPSQFPTMFGLRLRSDLDAGRPRPANYAQTALMTEYSDPRGLEWSLCAAPCQPRRPYLSLLAARLATRPTTTTLVSSPLHMLTSAAASSIDGAAHAAATAAANAAAAEDGLTPCLLAMQRLCCMYSAQQPPWTKDRIALLMMTPWTLALLLVQGQARMQLPSDPLHRGWEAWLKAMDVPAEHQLCLRAALLHYSMYEHNALAAASASAVIDAAALCCAAGFHTAHSSPQMPPNVGPVAQPAAPGLLLYRCQALGLRLHVNGTPPLRLVLLPTLGEASARLPAKLSCVVPFQPAVPLQQAVQDLSQHGMLPFTMDFSLTNCGAHYVDALSVQEVEAPAAGLDCATSSPATLLPHMVWDQVNQLMADGVAEAGLPRRHTHVTISFVLPADHGLDLSTTMLFLVDMHRGQLQAQSMVSLLAHCEVSPLPCSMPGVHYPLGTPNVHDTPSNRPSSRNSGRKEPEIVGPGSSGSSDNDGGISLVCLHESKDSYTARLAIAPSPVSDPRAPSGLSVVCDSQVAAPKASLALSEGVITPHDPSAPAAVSAHIVKLQLALPLPREFTMTMACPFHGGLVKAQLARVARTITLTLPKASEWPEDWEDDSQRVCIDELPEWGPDIDDIGNQLSAQFTRQQMLEVMRGIQGQQNSSSAEQEMKETIKALFLMYIQHKCTVHQVIDRTRRDTAKGTAGQEMYIRVHPPLRRMPDGRPALSISLVDERVAEHLVSTGAISTMRALKDFQAIMFDPASPQPRGVNGILCIPEELVLLRKVLRANAIKTQPTAWQQKHLPPMGPKSPWVATYIAPLFPEHLGGEEGMAALETLAKELDLDSTRGDRSSARRRNATATPQTTSVHNRSTAPATAPPQRTDIPGCAAAPVTGREGGQCWACERQRAPLLRCSRCKIAQYCNVECQKVHWKAHKASCQG